eukprot:scaffold127045_cov47-Prasinocladus_malaysianus.AAC.1
MQMWNVFVGYWTIGALAGGKYSNPNVLPFPLAWDSLCCIFRAILVCRGQPPQDFVWRISYEIDPGNRAKQMAHGEAAGCPQQWFAHTCTLWL